MADPTRPAGISSAFPAPPPFYESFTPQNIERLQKIQPSTDTLTSSAPALDPSSIPPELQNLIPPPPPADGKFRSFGTLHDTSYKLSAEAQSTPTPARLKSLTQSLLLSFLSFLHALATDPSAYAPIWEELHGTFSQIFELINAYRPHQARETLIMMMEDQIEQVRGETKAVRESVDRAREVLERLGNEDGLKNGDFLKQNGTIEATRARKDQEEKMVWEILEKEFGSFS